MLLGAQQAVRRAAPLEKLLLWARLAAYYPSDLSTIFWRQMLSARSDSITILLHFLFCQGVQWCIAIFILSLITRHNPTTFVHDNSHFQNDTRYTLGLQASKYMYAACLPRLSYRPTYSSTAIIVLSIDIFLIWGHPCTSRFMLLIFASKWQGHAFV